MPSLEAVRRDNESDGVVNGQAGSQSLVSGDRRTVTIWPVILVKDENGMSVLGVAKWIIDDPAGDEREPSNADIYQLIVYGLAHDVP